MIRIANQRQIIVYKTFMNGIQNRLKGNIVVSIFENGFDPIRLFYAIAENIQFISFGKEFFQVIGYQVKVFLKNRLWRSIKVNGLLCFEVGFITPFQFPEVVDHLQKLISSDVGAM